MDKSKANNYCHQCSEKLLSVVATAEMLSISPKSIRNKLSLGVFPIPSYRFGGRVLFKLSEVLKFIRNLE